MEHIYLQIFQVDCSLNMEKQSLNTMDSAMVHKRYITYGIWMKDHHSDCVFVPSSNVEVFYSLTKACLYITGIEDRTITSHDFGTTSVP